MPYVTRLPHTKNLMSTVKVIHTQMHLYPHLKRQQAPHFVQVTCQHKEGVLILPIKAFPWVQMFAKM